MNSISFQVANINMQVSESRFLVSEDFHFRVFDLLF